MGPTFLETHQRNPLLPPWNRRPPARENPVVTQGNERPLAPPVQFRLCAVRSSGTASRSCVSLRTDRSFDAGAHGPGICQSTVAQLANKWKTEDGTTFRLRMKKYPNNRAGARRSRVLANASRMFAEA
jgi:hypothetical protein